MSIIIKAKKEVSGSGIEGYRITGITALKDEELPEMYRACEDHCYLTRLGHLNIWGEDSVLIGLNLNDFYSEAEFNSRIARVRKCGEALRECNQILATRRALWNGNIEYVI